jgi:hypothetical protein
MLRACFEKFAIEELDLGKQVHLKEFPAGMELKLFRVVLSTEGSACSPPGAGLRARTELIVTNDLNSLDSEAVRFVLGFRWSDHAREVRLMIKKGGGVSSGGQAGTEIELCECRSARAQRNHVGCALLVWVFLKRHARAYFSAVYAVTQGLLDGYMQREPQHPSIKYAAQVLCFTQRHGYVLRCSSKSQVKFVVKP